MSMTSLTQRWPRGTGQWNRTRVLIVATDPRERERLYRQYADQHDVAIAASPLDVIRRLETDSILVSTVVISDVKGSAGIQELVEFLGDTYPYIRVMRTDRASGEDHIDGRACTMQMTARTVV